MPKIDTKLVLFMRNFIFGAEDSLVSTVGLLSGIAVGGVPKQDIVLTGIVLIFVEAFSMAVGSFLTEYSTEEYEYKKKMRLQDPLSGGFIMFVSYLVSGMIPLLPYLMFKVETAFSWSILASLAALFLLGLASARVYRISLLRTGLRMLLIGGLAIGAGVLIGQQFR